MEPPNYRFLIGLLGALTAFTSFALSDPPLELRGIETGVIRSDLQPRFPLRCDASEYADLPKNGGRVTRTQCHLTKQIIVGENRTSGVDLIFLDERLHEIRAAIDWTPPKGRSPSATNKLDEDVRLLHDAITLKYPNALRKEWKPQRQHNAPYKHSYTWSMSSGTIELVNRLPYTSGNIIELNIESEATKQLRVAFEAAKSRESLLRAEMHSRESAERAQRRIKDAASNL